MVDVTNIPQYLLNSDLNKDRVLDEDELVVFAQAIDSDASIDFELTAFGSMEGALTYPKAPPSEGSLIFHYLRDSGVVEADGSGAFGFDDVFSVFDQDGDENVLNSELNSVFNAAETFHIENRPDNLSPPPPREGDRASYNDLSEDSTLSADILNSGEEPVYTILSNFEMGWLLDDVEYTIDGEPLYKDTE